MSALRQISAITSINIKSIPQRFWMSVSTVVAIALVVGVLLGFLAMGSGFKKTLSSSGSKDVAILLRDGSDSEVNSVVMREQTQLVEEAPGIARVNGRPLVSAELYVIVDGKRRTNGIKANMPLRGLTSTGVVLRDNITITKGRMFRPGTNEVVVGQGLVREFAGFDLGQTLRFGTSTWTIVGVFNAGGSVFDSELWGDVSVVQSQFKRLNSYQTIRAKLTSPDKLVALKAYVDKDPRLKLETKSEADYYAVQAKQSSDLISNLGWPLAIIMTFGAVAGALNTMYSSVSMRTAEIGTLRAIGFGGFPTFVGTLIEAVLLAALGAIIGIAVIWLFVNGLTTSSLGASFTQVVFTFSITVPIMIKAMMMALLIGLVGGFFPALRAARQPIASMINE